MPTTASQLETKIAERIAGLQAEYYGIPPKQARAYYIPGELVVVVLRETFTPAEKVLIGHGDADAIQHSRRRFQQISSEDLARELRSLGDVIEAQVRILRDDYLATAAGLADLGMERPSVGPD